MLYAMIDSYYWVLFKWMNQSVLGEVAAELAVELVQLHLYPQHLPLAFVLQLPHVVYVAHETYRPLLDHHSQIQQTMEERITKEITDFVYQRPVPVFESQENFMIPAFQDVQMRLRNACFSE